MSNDSSRAFVLPLDRDAALFLWTNGELRQCANVLIPRDSPWVANVEDDLLCYAEGPKLFAVRGAFSGEPNKSLVHSGTDNYRFDALALKDGVLFAGGLCESEVLGSIDLHSTSPQWRMMPLSTELRHPGKSVDSFVLDGDRLLGLDDILLPKWWLVYDVTDARDPKFVASPPLATHSTYEVYRHAALSHRFIVSVSTSINHGQSSVHLAFFDRGDLSHKGAIHARAGALTARGSARSGATRDFAHVDALDELVVVCAGAEGCGLLDLRALGAAMTPDPSREERSRLEPTTPAFAALVEAKLRWCKREGGAAVRAFFCGASRVAVSWQREDGGCWVELVFVES